VLNKANPFEYLTELQKHAGEPSSEPDIRMPRDYRDMPNSSARQMKKI
jgi:hypothetical protein